MAEKEAPISLLDVSDFDITQVDELRFEVLPVMTGLFKITKAGLEPIGEDQKPAAVVVCEVVEVANATGLPAGMEPASLVGKEHREVFFFSKVEDIGRLKAFAVDVAFDIPNKDAGQKIAVKQLLAAMIGLTFPGRITHRKDKNDAERIYANVRPAKQAA